MTNIEVSLISERGEPMSIENLPTIETYRDSEGKLGIYRGEKIGTLSYDLKLSDGLPCGEITAIDSNNLKKRLTELAKEHPLLPKNKYINLYIFVTNSWSFSRGYIGQIKYKEIEEKSE